MHLLQNKARMMQKHQNWDKEKLFVFISSAIQKFCQIRKQINFSRAFLLLMSKQSGQTGNQQGSSKQIIDDELDEQVQQEEEKQNENEADQQGDKQILYQLLCLPQESSTEEIKQAYRKLALELHPDKNKQDPEAKEQFQKVNEAYQILSDPDKRKIYDETGVYGDDFNSAEFNKAYQYYRAIYKQIEEKDIVDFQQKYRYGEMENEDLIAFYNDNDGDISLILQSIPLSNNDDVERYIKFYEECFQNQSLKRNQNFDRTQKNIVLLENDEQEAEEAEKQKQSLNDLASQILAQRTESADAFFKSLQMKYGGAGSKDGKQKQKEQIVQLDSKDENPETQMPQQQFKKI